jgi:hypothetical protein
MFIVAGGSDQGLVKTCLPVIYQKPMASRSRREFTLNVRVRGPATLMTHSNRAERFCTIPEQRLYVTPAISVGQTSRWFMPVKYFAGLRAERAFAIQ